MMVRLSSDEEVWIAMWENRGSFSLEILVLPYICCRMFQLAIAQALSVHYLPVSVLHFG